MVTPAHRREAVAHLETAHEMSERRACRVIGVDRTSVRYQRTTPDDADLRARIKALAHERRRFGYRRLYILLRREGRLVNRKRVQRIYQEERLMVRRRGGRKRALGLRAPMAAPDRPNACWSLDFVHDQMTDGRRFRILAVVDNCTRECLALEPATNFKSLAVQSVLTQLFETHGAPQFLRSDNGSEFIARSLAVFLSQSGTQSRFIKPGSPWQNGHAESFVSRLRAELLDVETFHNLADAQVKLAIYRRYYNEQRPHSSLGYRTTAQAKALNDKDSC